MTNKYIFEIAEILALVGAVNWLLVVFGYNLVTFLTTALNQGGLTNAIYGLIGGSGGYLLYMKFFAKK